jgi:predicted amidophosphoribosyltransferase
MVFGFIGTDAPAPLCATCGGATGPHAAFCEHCGAALKKTCASCGRDNTPGAAFCAGCGTPLTPA